MRSRSLSPVALPLVLGLGLVLAPHLGWAQRQPTPAPPQVAIVPPTNPVVRAKLPPPPSPASPVTTVEADLPLCTELAEVLPDTVGVNYVDCRSAVGLACISTITFYGATTDCSNVFVKPTATPPTPTPAN